MQNVHTQVRTWIVPCSKSSHLSLVYPKTRHALIQVRNSESMFKVFFSEKRIYLSVVKQTLEDAVADQWMFQKDNMYLLETTLNTEDEFHQRMRLRNNRIRVDHVVNKVTDDIEEISEEEEESRDHTCEHKIVPETRTEGMLWSENVIMEEHLEHEIKRSLEARGIVFVLPFECLGIVEEGILELDNTEHLVKMFLSENKNHPVFLRFRKWHKPIWKLAKNELYESPFYFLKPVQLIDCWLFNDGKTLHLDGTIKDIALKNKIPLAKINAPCPMHKVQYIELGLFKHIIDLNLFNSFDSRFREERRSLLKMLANCLIPRTNETCSPTEWLLYITGESGTGKKTIFSFLERMLGSTLVKISSETNSEFSFASLNEATRVMWLRDTVLDECKKPFLKTVCQILDNVKGQSVDVECGVTKELKNKPHTIADSNEETHRRYYPNGHQLDDRGDPLVHEKVDAFVERTCHFVFNSKEDLSSMFKHFETNIDLYDANFLKFLVNFLNTGEMPGLD